MSEKKRYEKFVTPIGIAKYPRLSEPDFRFKKDTGEFSVKLLVPAEEAAELVTRLETLAEEQKDEAEAIIAETAKNPADKKKRLAKLAANDVVEREVDEERGEETGNIIFKASMPHLITANKGKENEKQITLRPKIFDAKKQPITGINIGGGSKLRVAGFIRPYYIPGTGVYGVKLSLDAVQVIELVEFGNRDADSYGFGAEEGYEAPAVQSASESPATAGGEEQGEDF